MCCQKLKKFWFRRSKSLRMLPSRNQRRWNFWRKNAKRQSERNGKSRWKKLNRRIWKESDLLKR